MKKKSDNLEKMRVLLIKLILILLFTYSTIWQICIMPTVYTKNHLIRIQLF